MKIYRTLSPRGLETVLWLFIYSSQHDTIQLNFQISQLLPTWSGYVLPHIPILLFCLFFLEFLLFLSIFLVFGQLLIFLGFSCFLFRQPPFFLCFSCFLIFFLVEKPPFTLCATFWYSNTPPNLRKKWISECSSPPVDIPSILYRRVLQRLHLDHRISTFDRNSSTLQAIFSISLWISRFNFSSVSTSFVSSPQLMTWSSVSSLIPHHLHNVSLWLNFMWSLMFNVLDRHLKTVLAVLGLIVLM